MWEFFLRMCARFDTEIHGTTGQYVLKYGTLTCCVNHDTTTSLLSY